MISAVVSAFFFAFLSIKLLEPVATNVGLVDKPNARKLHDGQIPLIGGIAIFVAVLMASLIWLPDTLELRMYLIASALMVFIGALDDKYDLRVSVRVIGQVIIASIMIYGVDGYIANFGNLFSFGDIDIEFFGIPFTYVAIIVVINAYNMVDGIDGLIGCLSLNTFASIAILFLLNGGSIYLAYPLVLVAATLPYLIFNLDIFRKRTKKIFMGDAGSMFIGLSVIWLLCIGTQGEYASFSPVSALWVCAVPLMDMLAVVIRRCRKGKSPFKPDRDHLHHILLRAGLSSNQALIAIFLFAILMSLIGLFGEYYKLPESIGLLLFVAVFFLYNKYIRHFSWKYDE